MTEQRWEPVIDGEIVLVHEVEESGFLYKLSAVVHGSELELIDKDHASMSVWLPDNLRLCNRVEVEATQLAAVVLYRVEGMVTIAHINDMNLSWYNVDDVHEDELHDKIEEVLAANVGQKISITVERVQP